MVYYQYLRFNIFIMIHIRNSHCTNLIIIILIHETIFLSCILILRIIEIPRIIEILRKYQG